MPQLALPGDPGGQRLGVEAHLRGDVIGVGALVEQGLLERLVGDLGVALRVARDPDPRWALGVLGHDRQQLDRGGELALRGSASPAIRKSSSAPAGAIPPRRASRWSLSRTMRAATWTVTEWPMARRRPATSTDRSGPCLGEQVTVRRTGSGNCCACSSLRPRGRISKRARSGGDVVGGSTMFGSLSQSTAASHPQRFSIPRPSGRHERQRGRNRA